MMDEFIGKQIGGYEIRERIGKGGMATVYLAVQTSMNRPVAIKLLPHDMMKDESYLQRFEREVSIVSTLEHRNIVPVHDHGNYNGQPYIVMRYMNAGSVDDLIRKGPLEPDRYLDIITQIAPALDYAHGKQILHRDLKPSNILLDDHGGAYITDFGIARILGSENAGATLTTQGVLGTPSYMSPEQAQGQPLDGRSDVYALGVMLFEMATGQRPFQSDTPYTIAVMHVTSPPPAPRSINANIPGAVEQVIYKALKKRPEDRYQSAMELAEALKMAISSRDFASHDTQKPSQRPQLSEHTQPSATPGNYGYPSETSPSRPLPQVVSQQTVPQQPAPQQTIPQNYAPNAPHPPSSLYPPPTPAPMPPANVARRMQARARKPTGRGMPMVGVLLGALIGCGLLTAVVIAVALAASSFLNGDQQTDIQLTQDAPAGSTGDDTGETTQPEEAIDDDQDTPGSNVQDLDGTLYLMPVNETHTPDPSQPTSRPRPTPSS